MSFLDFIAQAEGTSNGRGYNEVLGYGRYGYPERPLTEMTLDEVYDFGRSVLRHPENDFNSSAVGRYQIVGTTMRDLQETLGLSGDTRFTPEVQDRMARALLARRGRDPAALRLEWQGLEGYSDEQIAAALSGSPYAGPSPSTAPPARPALSMLARGDAAPDYDALMKQLEALSPARTATQPWDGQGPFLPHKHQRLADYGRARQMGQSLRQLQRR